MEVVIKVYRCGLGNKYWTYDVVVDNVSVPNARIIYRMYAKEDTAMRNGIRVLKQFLKP